MNASSPINVLGVVVNGNKRTKVDYFEAELQEALHSCNSLKHFYDELNSTTNRMSKMDVFESVNSVIDVESFENEKYNVRIEVNVKEHGVPFLKMSSYVRAGASADMGFEVEGALRNMSGLGDVLRLSSINSASGSRELTSSFFFPNIGANALHSSLNIEVKSHDVNLSHYSSFEQKIKSFAVDLTTKNGRHKLVSEYALRDEIPTATPGKSTEMIASRAIVDAATSSLKSSMKYIFTAMDSRDNLPSPTCGRLLQGSLEVALPMGTTQFIKSGINAQYHRTLGPKLLGQTGLLLNTSASLGMILPIPSSNSSGTPNIHLSDRYFLGGPYSLRGFDHSGVGPRAYEKDIQSSPSKSSDEKLLRGDALGGDTQSMFFAALSVPVPIRILAENHFRAFAFINAGSLGLRKPTSISNTTNDLANSGKSNKSVVLPFGYPRVAIGTGFSIIIGQMLRLEGTYSLPILKAPQDNAKPFQFGVSLCIE